jgi:hypothetical protein
MAAAWSREGLARLGLVLALGHVVAIGLAWFACGLLPSWTRDVERARALGIVSLTTLAGYSKERELAIYVLSVGIVVLGTIAAFWVASLVRPARGEPLAPRAPRTAPPLGALEIASVVFAIGWCVLDARRLATYWDGRWTFLSEEGMVLAAVERLAHGGSLYRDELALYGPLTFAPVRGLMALFGPHVLVLRGYSLAIDALGLVFLYFLLRTLLRSRDWAVAGLVFFLVNFACPYLSHEGVYRPSAHHSVLRYSIALAWIPCYFRRSDATGPRERVAAGVAIGLAFLLSQEQGAAAALSFALVALTGFSWKERVRDEAWVLLGLAAVLLPWVAATAIDGSLGSAWETLTTYPRLVMLGYANKPFPRPGWLPRVAFEILGADPSRTPGALAVAKAYWVPWIASVGASVIGVRWLAGRLDRDDRIAWALVLATGILFRSLLGRCDVTHLQSPLVAATVLALLLAARGSRALRSGALARRSPTALVGLALAAASVVVLRPPAVVAWTFLERGFPGPGKFSAPTEGLRQIGDAVPRARGIWLPEAFAAEFETLVSDVREHTRPEETIVAFPDEPAYYFFTERANASRFPITTLAITSDDRARLLGSWESRRPARILRMQTTLTDKIAESQEYPEVLRYLDEHYAPVRQVGDTLILAPR